MKRIRMVKQKARELLAGRGRGFAGGAALYCLLVLLINVGSAALEQMFGGGKSMAVRAWAAHTAVRFGDNLLLSMLATVFFVWVWHKFAPLPLTRKGKPYITETARPFSAKTLRLALVLALIDLAFSLANAVPSTRSPGPVLTALSALLTLVAVAGVVVSVLLSYTPLIYALHPDEPVSGCIRASVSFVKSWFLDIVVFELSFILWFLVPAALFFVGAWFIIIAKMQATPLFTAWMSLTVPAMFGLGLWYHPYHEAARLLFYQSLLEE